MSGGGEVSLGWGLDFWRAFLERPRFIRWLCKKLMGRYAWNELCGMKEATDKAGFNTTYSYGLQGTDYHKELDKYHAW